MMAERPLESDCIPNPIPAIWLLLLLIFGILAVMAFVATYLKVASGEHQGPVIWLGACVLTGYPLVGLVLMLVHRRDTIRMDDRGLTATTGGRSRTVGWDEIDHLGFAGTGPRTTRLTVRAGRERIGIWFAGFESNVAAAERLRLRLEPAWQARLARMAAGQDPLPAPVRIALIMLPTTLLLPISVLVHSGTNPDEPLSSLLLLVTISALFIFVEWSMHFRTGPATLRQGTWRWALDKVKTVRVVRSGQQEHWLLKGPKASCKLRTPYDFPLLCDFVIRECRGATFEYDVRAPRYPLEAAFLPLPPGATGELLVAPDAKTALRKERRWKWRYVLGVLAIYGCLIAAWQTEAYVREYQQVEALNGHSVATDGRVTETNGHWEIVYEVDGQRHGLELPFELWPAGAVVGLRYLPEQPWVNCIASSLPIGHPPARPMAMSWIISLGLGLLSVWLAVKERRDRGPQPTAVGF